MFVVESIAIRGSSDRGDFAGSYVFGGRSAIVSGPNGTGKSLMLTAVAWCLGLEPIYGVGHSNNGVFPEAARTRLQLEGGTAYVSRSEAELVLRNRDGAQITITRAIAGDDSDFARVDLSEAGRSIQRLLAIKRHKMADRSGGLHAFLFDWAGLPVQRLHTRAGPTQPIYLENLAALFFIEQLNGWTDVQSLQIHRYGHIDVDAACVEYCLGLRTALGARRAVQDAEASEEQLRDRGRKISDDLDRLRIGLGLAEPVPRPRRLIDMEKRFATLNPAAFINGQRQETLESELGRLKHRVVELQGRLRATDEAALDAPPSPSASSEVIRLKAEVANTETSVRTIQAQFRSQEQLLVRLEGKLQVARDLKRLKESNVGLPNQVVCPTCEQSLEPEDLGLSEQSSASIATSIDALERERTALKKSLARIFSDLDHGRIELTGLRERLAEAQREFRLMSQAAGPTAEVAVGVVSEVLKVERRIEVVERAILDCAAIGSELAAWRAEYADHEAALSVDGAPEEEQMVARFRETLVKHLVEIGHGALRGVSHQHVQLDDSYLPTFDDRHLSHAGSASDRARLVFAFSLALHQVSRRFGRWHPGVLLMDEPLQQNPDEAHRRGFVDLIAQAWPTIEEQVILITSFEEHEVTALAKRGVDVHVVDGTPFLQLTGGRHTWHSTT